MYETPLLLCPPGSTSTTSSTWRPGKSLVEWAVSLGLTTFAISYRNPDSSQRDLSFEDYLTLGPRAALDVVRAITGAPTVNTLSACIGGTLTTAMLAYLKATGESRRGQFLDGAQLPCRPRGRRDPQCRLCRREDDLWHRAQNGRSRIP